jgi:uncharacterized OsmC-like protein
MSSTNVAQQSPAPYRIHATTVGRGRAEASSEHQSVPFDIAWGSEPAGLFGPAELLITALAACLLKGIERSAQLMPFSFESADVDVVAERQESPPRFTRIRYELTVVTDESEHKVELLHENLRKFGTVYNTLATACDLDGTIRHHRRID